MHTIPASCPIGTSAIRATLISSPTSTQRSGGIAYAPPRQSADATRRGVPGRTGARPPCGQPGNPASRRGQPPPCSTCSPAPSLRDTLAALVKGHRSWKIRSLSRGKVRITFTAPGAGTLAARLSKGRTVLASGSHRYGRAGKGTVTLKLSRKGKRALRRARKVTATLKKLIFTPRGGRATSASGKVTLRR